MNANRFEPAPVLPAIAGPRSGAALLLALLLPSGLAAAAARNQPPSLAELKLETGEDVRVEGALVATDADGDSLSFKLVRRAARGEATVDRTTGAVGYTPAKDTSGDDAFTVEVSDGKLASKAQVRVKVSPVNDAPVAQPVSLATREDVAAHGASSATDADGDALAFRIGSPAAHGTASVDARSGALTYEPAADSNGADLFVVEASDGSLAVTFDVRLAVAAVNDAPVAAAAALSLDEDTRVTGTLAAADVDGDAVTFRVGKRPARGELELDARTGAFTYSPARDAHGAEGFTFEASDGKLKSQATVSLEVKAVNDPPVAGKLSLATREDAAVRGAVVGSDADGDVLGFKISEPPAHGTAEVEPGTGAVSYQPAADFNGADVFTVEVSDGVLTAKAAVMVAVAAVNDVPVLADQAFALDEDGKLEETLAASDVDGDSLTYELASKPGHGPAAVERATGKLGYAPARDYHGEDALTIVVSDGQRTATAKVLLRVRAVNDAPVARPLSLSTPEDTAARGTVVASDVDGKLTYSVKAAAQHGEARVDAAGAVTYQPAKDFNGADAFTVEVSDGELGATSEVKVAVGAVNDAPVAPAAAFTLDEDGRFSGKVPSSDVDGDALAAKLVARPAHGSASLEQQTGLLGYVPAKEFNGDDTVTVEVSDGKLKATSVVTLHVTPVNDAPLARPLALSTTEDTPTRGTVVASDLDRDALTFRVATPPGRGEASVDARTGVVTYAPGPDATGSDSFVVEVGDGAAIASSSVSVAIKAVDDPPVVRAATLETPEDTPAEGKLPGTEADGERLTFRILSAPSLGAVVLLDPATGAWRFTPAADRHGEDEVAFDVSDGKRTATGVVKLRVAAVNDAPLLPDLALETPEDRPVEGQLVGSDVDGDALTYSIAGPSRSGRAVVLDGGKGRVRFEPARDFHGEATFTVVANDGKLASRPATVTVTVKQQNDAPAAAAAKLVLDEDVVLSGTLGATDVDREALTFQVVGPPTHGAVAIVDPASGAFRYTPTENYSGEDAFSFSATDPSGASSAATVQLTVRQVNDPPVAVAESISAPYRGLISGRLKGYDREGRPVTFRVVERPAHGQIRLLDPSSGEFTFTTDGTSSSAAEVRFEVSDGELTSKPAELIVRIRSR